MITFIVVCISAAAQLGLIWLSGQVTRGWLPVPDGPNLKLRKFAVWVGSGFFNTLLVNLPPVFINLFLSLLLEAVGGRSSALGWSTNLATLLGWAYPALLVWQNKQGEVRDDR